MVPVWPKCSTPSERVRWPSTEPSQASVAGWPSMHGDQAAMRRQPRPAAARYGSWRARGRARGPAGRGPAGIEPVGRGDGEQADVAPVLGHQADRLDRLRRHRAGIGDDDLRSSGPGLRSQ